MSTADPEYSWDHVRRNGDLNSAVSPSIASTHDMSIAASSSPESHQRLSLPRPYSHDGGKPGSSKKTKGKAKFIPNRVKRYHERSLDGCLTCRKRRVKCDEAKPVCRRCACGNRECIYPNVSSSSNKLPSPSSAGPSREVEAASAPRSQHSGLQVASLLHPSNESPGHRRSSSYTYGGAQKGEPSSSANGTHHHGPNVAYLSPTELLNSASSIPRRPTDMHYRYPSDTKRPGPDPGWSDDRYRSRRSSALSRRQASAIDVSRAKLPDLPAGFGFERLEPYFPSLEQQSLFRHYIIEVIPQLCVMRMPLSDNRWIRYHATFAVRSPAGTNGYEDALRSALLSIASLDIGHKLSQTPIPQSHPNTVGAYNGIATNGLALTSNVLLELSNTRREESLRLLKTTLKERSEPLQRSDAALMLATVLGLATRDRLAAQQDWQEALSIVSKAITELGGPAAFVDHTDPSSLFLIEQIACFDALSSLTSDDYTLFLQPWDDWWYALMDSPRSFKEDSVLQTFGLHRGMIDMLARLTRVEATRRELQSRTGVTITLSDMPGGATSVALPVEYEETRSWLESTARALATEIPIWAKVPEPKEGNRTIQAVLPVIMNHLYVAAAELYIHSVIFSKPADHPCFLEPTAIVLDRCEEAIQTGITKGLLLPISFAAFSARKRDRDRIRIMLNNLRPYYKFDLDRMEKFNDHLWRLVDAGLMPMDWHLFMKSVGCFNWAF